MTRFLCLLVLLPLTSLAEGNPNARVSLSRTLTVFRCEESGNCTEIAKEDGPANFTVEFEKRTGLAPHGEEKSQVVVDGSPFKAEIILNEIPKGLSIYLVLRSGPTLKRHGVTKKAVVNPSQFSPLVLEDEVFRAGGKIFRAKLVVGPAH